MTWRNCNAPARTCASRSIPTAPCPSRSRPSASPPPTTTPATPDGHQEPHQHLLLPPRRLHCKRKKFHTLLDDYKLDHFGQRECPRPQREECPNDGLQSKSIENVRVQKCQPKHRHLVMVGAKLIEFAGNFTLRLYKALVT